MRGIKATVNLTDTERESLDLFGRAVYAANSVDAWALEAEGHPYWYADRALMAALTDLFGVRHAGRIRAIHIDSGGESVTYAIDWYFTNEYGRTE